MKGIVLQSQYAYRRVLLCNHPVKPRGTESTPVLEGTVTPEFDRSHRRTALVSDSVSCRLYCIGVTRRDKPI